MDAAPMTEKVLPPLNSAEVRVSDLAPTLLADADHPRVHGLAQRLTKGARSKREAADRLAHFVREHIAFGLPSSGDETSASRTLALGYGHCTARATLLVALARAAGIPARVHFARFDKSIYRDLVPNWIYPLLPGTVAIGWAELHVEGRWEAHPQAGHDEEFERGAAIYLRERGRTVGAGVTRGGAVETAPWAREVAERFPLVADDGSYRDAMDYLWSEKYPNRLHNGALKWLLSLWGREEFFAKAQEIRAAARVYAETALAA